MCLIVEKNKEVSIASENIICYKAIGLRDGRYFAPYWNFEYELNVLYETEMSKEDGLVAFDVKACNDRERLLNEGFVLTAIAQGFHSSSTIKRLGKAYTGQKIMKCIIPKGAEYYEDYTDLLVSNKIMLIGEITDENN